jgi:peptidyl-prolyl cis-trans isomerase D
MLQQLRESAIGKVAAIAILSLIAVTFIFFGNFDFGFAGSTFAAKVNGNEVPLGDFQRELQQTQNQYQQALRVELTEDLRRELRRNVIDQMVMNEALQQHLGDVGYRVSDERVAESVRSTEAFQVGGEFSSDAYAARLNSVGLTVGSYEGLVREQLSLLEIQSGLEASTFFTPAEYRRYIELYNERREIGYATFSFADFLPKVDITDEAIAQYFEENGDRFRTEETVDIEYIELTLADIAAGIELTEQDLLDYYNENQDRFSRAEERRVRHILINVEGDDYAAAEARAQAVLDRLNNGEDFATLAQEVSDDAGTRSQGGDLGWIGRGLLVGPFEDTLFEMQVGEIAGPVETEFGYHILRLDEVRSGDVQPFEAVRDELQEEVSTDRAAQGFYDKANELDLKAFDARNSLNGVAEELGLTVKTIDGFPRSGDPDVFANSAPIVAAVFDEDAIFSGDNTDLIEIGDDDVVVARVVAHHPPEPETLEAVADGIRDLLSRADAQELAVDAAAAFLSDLEMGAGADDASANADAAAAAEPEVAEESVADESAEAAAEDADAGSAAETAGSGEATGIAALAEMHGGQWAEPRFVQRSEPGLPNELLSAAFNQRKPADGEVVRRRVPLSSGDEAVLVLSAVEPGRPGSIAAAERDARQSQLADQAAQQEMFGYAGNVRDRASVTIPESTLDPQF